MATSQLCDLGHMPLPFSFFICKMGDDHRILGFLCRVNELIYIQHPATVPGVSRAEEPCDGSNNEHYVPPASQASSHLMVTSTRPGRSYSHPMFQMDEWRLGMVEGSCSRSHRARQRLNPLFLTPVL